MSNILLFVFRRQKPAHMPLFTLSCVQCIVKSFTKPAMHACCNKFTNSQESVINKERSGRSVVLMAGQVVLYRQHFLDYEQTSWIKMYTVDLVKHFSLYTGHI